MSFFQPINPQVWLAGLENRFGMPASAFKGYLFFYGSTKYISIAPKHFNPPSVPKPINTGFPFLRITGHIPKLTTGAALQFGHLATRNIIHVTLEQADAFLCRHPSNVSPIQCNVCTGQGYVLVQYDGLMLGIGHLDLRHEKPILVSLLPKRWARR